MTAQIPDYDLPETNRQVRLVARPVGTPKASDFEIVSTPVSEPGDGQLLVRNLYLSADPVQRGWAANDAVQKIGDPMRSLAVGVAVKSRVEGIADGDLVYGFFGWQDYAIARRADVLTRIGKPRVSVSSYAGALGMPGVTAWLAFNGLAPPTEGQTVLVSTAAGTVGSIVGQIAARAGARPIGLTGSDDKVAMCKKRFGYAEAFNYKTVDLDEALSSAAPDGLDTFYDNTGGAILDTAIRHMKRYGRIIACGTAATPSWSPPPTGLRNEREILLRALTWSGFVIFDHADRFEEAVERLAELSLDGELQFEEDIDEGMPAVLDALPALFSGANRGKKLVFVGKA
ncbi:NADP-dependent oxidoreductase [Novosphingobium marinum]|uniref:Enoyl reductase (ER) domain-containing protein n=1 Tax=Novosphingobium marinum TaxID=1514948 RepID=A0A7Y9XSY7_9SPHN|nr:NADP-dependent oxidoreductase [Novosphingobium marinum]NYH93970.1 hypothetical protein [Novosphingobium marinum]